MPNGQVKEPRLAVHKIRVDIKMGGTQKFKAPFVGPTQFLTVDKLKASCGGCTRDLDLLEDGIVFTYKDQTKPEEFITESGEHRVAVEAEKYVNVIYVNDPGEPRTDLWIKNERGVDVINYLNRPWEQITLDVKVTK